MPSWIVFDAVGTLLAPEPSVAAVYHRVGLRHGSRLDEETVRVRFHAAFRATEREDLGETADGDQCDATISRFRTSESREERRWHAIVAAVLDDVADREACFRSLWDHFARPESWRCFDDVAPAAERLASRGHRLAIASNFDSRLHTVCDGLPNLQRFGPRVVSSEVGWRKPSAGFFTALGERLRCEPHEMLLVGDDWRNDVLGARAAGLRAVHLDRNSRFTSGDTPRGDVTGELEPGEATPRIATLDDLDRLV